MSRLIDAEHFEQMLIDLIDHGDHKNAYVHHAYKMRNIAIKECRNMLWEEPTVDVVNMVRCKDCTYWLDAKENEKGFFICPASGMEITEDDFCSYGEEQKWDGITDVDFEHKNIIWFHTKHDKDIEIAKVVRCKDCKYFDPHGSGFKIEGSGACTRVDNHVLTMKTGFCWLGEKVTE